MSKKTVYKALIENWGYVKRNVKLADVVDHLIQKDIISIEQWSELKKNTNLTEKERMEEFMMDFFKKDNPEVIRTFLEALRENQYEHVADLIDGGSSSHSENDGLQASNDVMMPMQNNEASGHQSSTLFSNLTDTVGRNDRTKLKDEITNEIVDKFMGILMTIDSKITTGFQKQKSEFEEFKSHLMTVQELTTRLFDKERECQELIEKTHELEKDLIKQGAEYSITIQTKETEKKELEKRFQEKADDYKELQEKLIKWKESEEERYKILTRANYERAEMERKYKTTLEEKIATDEKYMALSKKHDDNLNFDSNKTLISRIQELEGIEKELRAKIHVLENKIVEITKEKKSLEDIRKRRPQHRIDNTTLTLPISPRKAFISSGNPIKPQAGRKTNQK